MTLSKITLLLLTLFVGASALTSPAEARGGREGRNVYRYHTTYDVWDRSVYRTYGYTERSSYSNCRYNTCYYNDRNSWRSSDVVYVEETVVVGGRWDGYTRVAVYSDGGYSNRYANYYVQSNRVVYREYCHSHVYIYRPFTMTEAIAGVVRDFDSDLQTIAVIGGGAIDIGIMIAQIGSASGDDDTATAGLAIAAAGAASASIASAEQDARNKAAMNTPLSSTIVQEERAENGSQTNVK